jgi:aminopeptidase N
MAQEFGLQDSLRGFYGPDRSCYNLIHYHLQLSLEPETRFISGYSKLTIQIESQTRRIQIDLAEDFDIDSIVSPFGPFSWTRNGKAVLVSLKKERKPGEKFWVKVFYRGHPHVAVNPPWEGGFVWQKDKDGFPWIGVACEGEGSSLWFPSKDHPADEADSAKLEFEVPRNLLVVSNGQFLGKEKKSDSTYLYKFRVSYPINHYNITFNAGAFSSWEENIRLTNGKPLKMSFFSLPYETELAKIQFQQAKGIIEVLSDLFGQYPFTRDGYKVVRTPYLGMEHQSCIAHGDRLQDNGFGFDFILMHETGHEWWGNRTSASDHADMWIHESFCTYSEALFVERKKGKEKAEEYLIGQKKKIKNKSPIQGPTGVYFNGWKDSDMYYKGAWMLHSLRFVVNNEVLWFSWLKSFGEKFGFSPISGVQVVEYASQYFAMNLEPFFNQFLKTTKEPVLEYKWETKDGKREVWFRLNQENNDFQYPLPVIIEGKKARINPEKEWKKWEFETSISKLEADERQFLFKLKEVKN